MAMVTTQLKSQQCVISFNCEQLDTTITDGDKQLNTLAEPVNTKWDRVEKRKRERERKYPHAVEVLQLFHNVYESARPQL